MDEATSPAGDPTWVEAGRVAIAATDLVVGAPSGCCFADNGVQKETMTMTSPTSEPTTLQPLTALHTGSGEPVVLLHGFMTPRCWEPVAARLSSTCEVFAPALTGHWGGPELRRRFLNVAALADQIDNQLDELGWRTCHIAGNSLGAWIGFELAARGRARTLTAIAPAGGWDCPSLLQLRIGLKFLALLPIVQLGKHLSPALRYSTPARRLALTATSGDPSAVPERAVTTAITAALHCPAMLPLLIGGLRMPGPDQLTTLKTPVRLVICEHDRVTPNRSYTMRFLRDLPDPTDLIVLPGAGHVPMLEAPDRIAALIAEHIHTSIHERVA
ncbi:alpha/beta fold hydrolase [Nocardia miyunensis]|uniref:alpha/beta fold hydrolase n=1 Tax=Nocardia miyunensis TaxID=282684 RepID=UPI001FDEDA57|nr:alpha/beta hydrolase [Nocardia miyunensis]